MRKEKCTSQQEVLQNLKYHRNVIRHCHCLLCKSDAHPLTTCIFAFLSDVLGRFGFYWCVQLLVYTSESLLTEQKHTFVNAIAGTAQKTTSVFYDDLEGPESCCLFNKVAILGNEFNGSKLSWTTTNLHCISV